MTIDIGHMINNFVIDLFVVFVVFAKVTNATIGVWIESSVFSSLEIKDSS